MNTETLILIADILRCIDMILCGLAVWLSCVGVYYYHKRMTFERLNFIRYRKHLAWHVYGVAISMTAISCGAVYDLYHRFNEPMTWRSPFILVVWSVYAVSQFFLMKSQVAAYNDRVLQVSEIIKDIEKREQGES